MVVSPVENTMSSRGEGNLETHMEIKASVKNEALPKMLLVF